MALKNYNVDISGVQHTIQANSSAEAEKFGADPKEVKSAAPANKADTPLNK